MEQFRYTIQNELGIHARPAGLLVKKIAGYKSTIIIRVNENQAPANKLFAIMGLCAKQGDELIVIAEGEDEKAATEGLKTFFEQNL